MMVYEVTILGPAQSQGSKRLIRNKKTGQTFMIEQTAKSRPWRQDLVALMMEDRPQYPIDEAVSVKLLVFVKRPRAHYNRKGLKETAPAFPKSGKDQDKIQRAVGDAAKIAGWVVDDSRIAHWEAWRLFVGEGEPERTVVSMHVLTDMDLAQLRLVVPPKEGLDKFPLFNVE